MKKMKLYYLYILMLSSACLFGMEEFCEDDKIESQIENIHNFVDRQFLGIGRNAWFKSVIGSVLSFGCASVATTQYAQETMDTIESYIKSENKKVVLKNLIAQHWYVYYLMRNLISVKVDEIKQVTGSTVDKIYNYQDKSCWRQMVNKKALKKFFDKEGIYESIISMPKDTMHSTFLPGKYRSLLGVSSDSKYLLSTNMSDEKIVWDMESAKQIVLADEDLKKIQWIFGSKKKDSQYYITDIDCNYFAITAPYGANIQSFLYNRHSWDHVSPVDCNNPYIKTLKKYPAIILFKRPDELSYLCHLAFKNSECNTQELLALRESKSITKITGFPQKNLKRFITEEIDSLEPSKKISSDHAFVNNALCAALQ